MAVYAKANFQAAKKELTASKKKYEAGGYPAETILGEPKRKTTEVLAATPKSKF